MEVTDNRFKEEFKQTIILSIITIFIAQVNIHVFTQSFSISLATACLPAFLYLLDDVVIIPLSLLSGFGIFGSRVLVHYIQTGNTQGVVADYMPEIIFFFSVGILLYLFDMFISHNRRLWIYIPGVMLIDYISNALELFARLQMDSYTWNSQLILIAVACFRGLLLAVILGSLDRYRVLLMTRTHADRYQRLIMLISRLRGEVIWMEKSADMIEKTMSTSYGLYDELKADENERNQQRAKSALDVAKDVHEIKKEYLMIRKGIQDALQSEADTDGMYLTEILMILTESIRAEFPGKVPMINMEINKKLYTRDPYIYLSIFHNLIANAIEASNKKTCAIGIRQTENDDSYIFTVHDNGPGIPIKYRDRIFTPRFSTKVDYETGEVNRGLGLCIVKDMLEENLGGTIRLSNNLGGATFVFTVPKEKMEATA